MKKLKVAVGLSGGVDSAVSAYLLKKQGFDISGVYLHCFDDDAPGCRGKQDRQDALKVAVHLKIPFQVLDFRRQYKSAVIAYFKKEYLSGRTPNPDVICNRDIKFGLLLDWCVKNGFDYLATGHYAALRHPERPRPRVGGVEGSSLSDKNISIASLDSSARRQLLARNDNIYYSTGVYLVQPKDLHKDQTYFLWAVPRQNFSRVLFPLSDFRKQDVRSVAKFAKIPVAAKPDSTGICFIGEVRVEDFLKRLGVKEKAGEVVTRVCGEYPENGYTAETVKTAKISNRSTVQPFNRSDRLPPQSHRHTDSCYRVIGSHRGVAFYTIGQRHGFSVDRWPPKSKAKGKRQKAKGNTGTGGLLPSSFFLLPSIDRPPLYVISKDVRRNRLIVGFGPETYRDNFQVSGCNWLVSEKDSPSGTGKTVLCRIRHGGELIPCSLTANRYPLTVNPQNTQSRLTISDSRLTVRLFEAQRGIAAGQSAVFYSKDGLVLGGGVIQ